MIATLVYVRVKKEFIHEFIEASRLNHESSVKEKGNLRFDIIQNEENPASFVFYEVYEDEQAIAEHKRTAHYTRWREKVETWMEAPRKGVRHKVLFPQERKAW